jgi:hypothetical protein
MEALLFVIALVVIANLGCILTFDRAARALRDLGAVWVRAISRRRVVSSHSA